MSVKIGVGVSSTSILLCFPALQLLIQRNTFRRRSTRLTKRCNELAIIGRMGRPISQAASEDFPRYPAKKALNSANERIY